MDRQLMLSYLRNPYEIDELELRVARLYAAEELDRLYKMEEKIKSYIETLGLKVENLK